MKKMLIVSYMFPPISGGGTQRPLKFTKYLPQFGIQPIVFCPRYARWKAEDPTLLNQPFLKSTEVYRCGIRRLARYYRLRYDQERRMHLYYFLLAARYVWYLDFFSAWFFECRRRVLEIVRKERIDCIFTTSPPHSIHLFGLWIKRKCGIPWIMDLRDAMVDDPNRKSNIFNRFQKTVEYCYEKMFYPAADAITTVSEPISRSIGERHAALDLHAKLQVLPNGFDEEDFEALPTGPVPTDKFTVTYTGSFMGKQTPRYFLSALRHLVSTKQINPADIRVRFVGHLDSTITALIESYQPNLPVEIKGFLPHRQSLRMLVESTLVLLIVSISAEEGGSQTMTGKFFEYLGAQRPIFALIPDGSLRQIIEKGNLGMVVDPKNVEEIAAGFKQLYDQWKSKGDLFFRSDQNLRDRFSRKILTSKLARIL